MHFVSIMIEDESIDIDLLDITESYLEDIIDDKEWELDPAMNEILYDMLGGQNATLEDISDCAETYRKIGDKKWEAFQDYFFVRNLETYSNYIDSFENDYCGEFKDEEDFARHYIKNFVNIPENLQEYFDYESYADDLFLNQFFITENGYVFSNY